MKAIARKMRNVPTYDEVFAEYMRLEGPTLGKSTKKNYTKYSAIISQSYGNMAVDEIPRQGLVKMMKGYAAKYPRSSNGLRKFMHLIFAYAEDLEYIDKNPIYGKSFRRNKERKYDLKLDTDTLWDVIYPNADKMLRRAIALGFYLVQHWEEVSHIAWDDFKQARYVVKFKRKKTGEPIEINYSKNRALIDWLEKTYPEREPGSKYIVCHHTKDGWKPYSSIGKMWAKVLKKAGLPEKAYVFKELRHLANTTMKDKNISKDGRKAVTGHTTDAANDFYTHRTGVDTIEAEAALAEFRPDEW